MAEIYLAGGCFWGSEKYISLIRGVLETEAGYANGDTENPTYEEVCRGVTGHAEAVRVLYDADILSLELLLDLYYDSINPVSLNRQGNDFGTQYRTGIYYVNEADLPVIKESIDRLQRLYTKTVQIEAEPLRNFSPAEEYHQKYLDKNPGGYCHIPAAGFKKAAEANAADD